MGVNASIVQQLEKQNIIEATPIQEKVIPLGLKECSPIVISSETGSGKTLAYLIPYLNSYLSDPTKRLLVYVPQRELAYQVNTVLHRIIPEIRSSVLVSGSDHIAAGKKPNVIIGTPTLMNDFIMNVFRKADSEWLQKNHTNISHIVFDEADMLLTQKINKCPIVKSLSILQKHNPSMEVVFAGATLPRNGKRSFGGIIQSLYPETYWCESSYYNHLPPSIHIEFKELHQEGNKQSELEKLLPQLQSQNSLLFVNSEGSVRSVCRVLDNHSVHYQLLSKKLQSEERKEALKLLGKNSNQPLCTVCRGLAARGLDTTNVDFVLNYDFPSDVRQFIHRCGRTGRKGNHGEVVCFVLPSDAILYQSILKAGVYGDLSGLYSRHRKLNRRYKEQNKKESL